MKDLIKAVLFAILLASNNAYAVAPVSMAVIADATKGKAIGGTAQKRPAKPSGGKNNPAASEKQARFDSAAECSCDAGKYCLNPRNVAFCVNRKGQKRMLGSVPAQ